MTSDAQPVRRLRPGQTCEVWTYRVSDGERRLRLRTTNLLLEAPNWTLDGTALVLNGAGVLWRLNLADGALETIAIGGVPDLNNDHVLSPDGRHIYVSANDWHIYRAPLHGGQAERVSSAPGTDGLLHFLHGVDPLDERLAFIGLQPDGQDWWARADVFTMLTRGGGYRRLTNGPGAADGCEFSPDGRWIYFNTEAFDGHAQIARMRADGSHPEQLTYDERVNWFPHLAPRGPYAVYLSYPPGTQGHPADHDVRLMLVEDGHWQAPRTVAELHGGQGTINVPSWAPDGDSFAYVAYPTSPASEHVHTSSINDWTVS